MYEVVVAVCCYKQKHWLHRCLRSLSTQTLEKSKYEVVVVNDDPNDRLEDIINVFDPHMNIRLINNDERLTGSARVIGYRLRSLHNNKKTNAGSSSATSSNAPPRQEVIQFTK